MRMSKRTAGSRLAKKESRQSRVVMVVVPIFVPCAQSNFHAPRPRAQDCGTRLVRGRSVCLFFDRAASFSLEQAKHSSCPFSTDSRAKCQLLGFKLRLETTTACCFLRFQLLGPPGCFGGRESHTHLLQSHEIVLTFHIILTAILAVDTL